MNFTAAGSPGTFIIDANGKQDNEACCGSGALEYQIVAATNTYLPQITSVAGVSGFAGTSMALKASGGGGHVMIHHQVTGGQ
jgi:hypothetical protein